ncbi:MAG: hypothetical protein EXR81_06400, partial [Gammaproteobacteria bacterium]|nr:hypothetical protein [Gammaproteobacteria bacterium]
MSNNSLDEVKDITIKKTVTWYTTGKLDPTIIANNFVLNSPYYKNQDRAAFIKEFVDSDFYKKAVLDKL